MLNRLRNYFRLFHGNQDKLKKKQNFKDINQVCKKIQVMAETSRIESTENEPAILPASSQGADCFCEVDDMFDSIVLVDSLSTDSSISCRICKFNAGDDLISSPCKCKGSMGWVHVTCLEEWLTGSTRVSCELCSMPFNVIRTPKYGYFQSLWIFLTTRISILRLLRDSFFLTVSLVNTCILVYMWLAYIFNDLLVVLDGIPYSKQQSEENLRYRTSPIRSLIFSVVFTLCLVFVSLNTIDDFRRIFYFYFLPWHHWRKSSVEVKLVVDSAHKPNHNQ